MKINAVVCIYSVYVPVKVCVYTRSPKDEEANDSVCLSKYNLIYGKALKYCGNGL